MAKPESESNVTPVAPCVRMMAGAGVGTEGAAQCPMAAALKGAGDNPAMGYLIMLPGILFVALGVLILFQPAVLVWLMAGVSIIIGILLLLAGNFLRKMGARMRSASL